ncbi:MAG: hypothetical protein ABIR34_04580 [Marmoricola sp.]
MGGPDVRAFQDADSILGSLSVMVARTSAAGTLPDGFVGELMAADPSGARLCQLLARGTACGARFGAAFLREAGRSLFGPGLSASYDAGRAWLDAAGVDAGCALDVLEDRELATWLLESVMPDRAAARARSTLLRTASTGEGADSARSLALAAWVRHVWTATDGVALTAPFDGPAVLLSSDVVALDEIASHEDHPIRAGMELALLRMRGDQLALSALADRCARFNRLRIQGEAPADRPAAVFASCRLLDFVLRPLLGDAGRGGPGEGYLRVAHELTAMTALWTVMRDGGDARSSGLVARWPGASEDQPARIAELDRSLFRALLDEATQSPGLEADLVAASREPARTP